MEVERLEAMAEGDAVTPTGPPRQSPISLARPARQRPRQSTLMQDGAQVEVAPEAPPPRPYTVLAYKTMATMAERLVAAEPQRFRYFETSWGRFEDSGMDDIVVGGFAPTNLVRHTHVLMMCDFHSNDAILSQLHVLIMLCESFIASLTIFLPYLPVATKERVTVEGQVATANTVSRMLSSLPHHGPPARCMFFDLHTLQQRFYLHSGAAASMHSCIPLLQKYVLGDGKCGIDALAFPDEGAQKRRSRPARACPFVSHAAFPGDSYRRFCKGGDRAVFDRIYVTNSNPLVAERLAAVEPFVVLDILPQLLVDL
ncbi:ribose phosphate diphosphokinase [Aureococcus anophagefferens]|nr:ribose phosphate diphosphokinase [Aureococcus anophagefferens]